MFPDTMLSKAFKLLSLATHPTPTPISSTRQLINQLRTLSQDAELKPSSKTPSASDTSTDQAATRFALLADLLQRRAAIFEEHRKVLSGKQKHYDGMCAAEARALWEEVDAKVGMVMRAWVQGEVFSEEQVAELKEMVCPHYDWA